MITKQKGEGDLECYGYEVVRQDESGRDRLVRVTRLNIGCGRSLYIDCVNADVSENVMADVTFDIAQRPWPFQADTFSSVFCSHVIEHLLNPLDFMEELARVCCPGAVAVFHLPYGSSDNAWEDPTHCRPYFLDSFGYFSQAAYEGADYGYKGDWTVTKRELRIKPDRGYEAMKDDLEQMLAVVMTYRNVVDEFRVVTRNIKPPRTPADAREASPIEFMFLPSQRQPSNGKENPS